MLTKAFSITIDGQEACIQNFESRQGRGQPCSVELEVRVLAKHQWNKKGQTGVKLQDVPKFSLLEEFRVVSHPLRDGVWGFGTLHNPSITR